MNGWVSVNMDSTGLVKALPDQRNPELKCTQKASQRWANMAY